MKNNTQSRPVNSSPVFDTVDFIMRLEGDGMPEDELIDGFQHLIDSGMAWSLQGSYGRMAVALIEAGRCHR